MIVNMVKIATESVNINNAVEFETQAVKQFESKQSEGFIEKISKVKFLTDSEKHVKVRDDKVFFTNLIYSRVIVLQASP